jgi:hypothetical protein
VSHMNLRCDTCVQETAAAQAFLTMRMEPDRTPLTPVASTGCAVTPHPNGGIGAIGDLPPMSHLIGGALAIAWIVFVLVPIGTMVAAMWAGLLAQLSTTTISNVIDVVVDR